ncbi:hypothetical protein [Pseudoteredinibacter isoporae]|uniref:Type II secretion system protein C n=1 Tax=Pseudoteredinibacter isoporae TaxID=570281 RepID=A0A7X0JSQ0_9GAMM|nr:hypothetical protein [Pseudoteredinibacter isoporae]MBB6521547.1 type II secretion system protein C [Pseudoteredinibacter isoporae]NHO87101.1 hypothetical protein [Pseudoteredinibacter isoporae]NIB22925.1 hypothetical protein [Pseudoteredinibacter isoporae]
MAAFRSMFYQLYARLPLGVNRRAMFEWTSVVLATLAIGLSAWHWQQQETAQPNEATLAAKPATISAAAKLEQSSTVNQKTETILDKQAQAWQDLEDVELVGLIRSNGKQSFAIVRWHDEQLVLAQHDSLPQQKNILISAIHTDSITLTGPWGEKQLGLNGREIAEQKNAAQVIKLPQLRNIILHETDSIADHIQAQANYENGELKSLSLMPSTSTALFEQAGLERGDQLTHVNDIPIANLGLSSVPGLLSKGKMELQLKRDGLNRQLTLLF